jgi:hypothetical protein
MAAFCFCKLLTAFDCLTDELREALIAHFYSFEQISIADGKVLLNTKLPVLIAEKLNLGEASLRKIIESEIFLAGEPLIWTYPEPQVEGENSFTSVTQFCEWFPDPLTHCIGVVHPNSKQVAVNLRNKYSDGG